MAIRFDNGGTGKTYYAYRTTGLGSASVDNTLIFQFLADSSMTTQQGVFFSFQWSATPQNHGLGSNGTSLYATADSGAGTAFGVLPSTTVWMTYVLSRKGTSTALNSGHYFARLYDGSSWYGTSTIDGALAIAGANGNSSHSALQIELGNSLLQSDRASAMSKFRSYNQKGINIAYLRYWAGTYLTPDEVIAEIASATPVKSGCTLHFTGNNTYNDALGGDALTPSATTPVLNTTLPETSSASVAPLAAYYKSLRTQE